jgi:thiol-disulfide isomerase/thioredoxin
MTKFLRSLAFTLCLSPLRAQEAAPPAPTPAAPAVAPVPVAGQAAGPLRPGDAAPALACGKFVQGEPVTEYVKDTVYIVEFWATWCGPCKQTIPHLNELALKFKDKGLVVIGQNVSEPEDGAVEPFVKSMGDKMTYRVALDDKSKLNSGSMDELWMKAAQQQGIPCAFVVGKDQKLAWIGHPGQLDEVMLQQVMDGTFDPTAASKAQEAEAEKRKQLTVHQVAMGKAIREQDWAAAEAELMAFGKMLDPNQRKYLAIPRLHILVGQKRVEEATKLAAQTSEEQAENLGIQYQLGSALLNMPAEEKGAVDLAEKIGRKALEKAEGQAKPMCQALVAKALFLAGKQNEAVELQAEAVESLPEGRRAGFQKVLDAYKDGKMPIAEKL